MKEIDLTKEMKTSFLSYAMSVIVARALPDVRDGMKPVHRRILFAMDELGVGSDKPYKKSARIVGDVMGKYHPHGDSAIYDSMVRMAQNFSYRYPLVDGQGNFGSIDGDGAAAMRYTEARMSKIAMELLRDLGKNTVDFQDNYDGSEKEPVVLPCRFPNILVNGATGIAVGMATNIPPHNLSEVIDGILALIKNPDISIEGLMNHIKGPDFPTGGCIMGLSQVRKAYMTGNGTITIRAKCEIKELENGKIEIIITEIPYQVNKTKLIERIAFIANEKIVEGITGLQDESTRKGMRIVVELRRDTNPNVVLNNLYKHTQLQSTFGVNILALDKGQPKVLNLKEVLECYLEHQIEVITRRTQYDLEKAEARAHIVEGLLTALGNIDAVIQLIKRSKTTEDAVKGLIEAFNLTEIQAKAILDMKLQRLTGLEIDKLKEELASLKREISEYKEILKNQGKKLEIIIGELTEMKEKFGDARNSEISLSDDLVIEDADLIPVEDVIITVTNKGYVKRMTVDTYRAQNRGGKGITGAKISDADYVDQVLFTSTHDTLLFFSNFGKIYRLKAFQIPISSRIAKGLPIVNILNFDENEKLAAVVNVKEEEKNDGYLLFATRRGIVKKTEISEFSNIRTNGIKAILLNDGDELFEVSVTDGEKDIILGASNGKAIRFSESDIRPMGRIAAGVRGLKVEDGEQMVGMAIVNTDGDEIVIVTEKGYGKRTNVDAFRVQVRGGKGVKALNITAKNGKMISLSTVRGDEDLLVITDKGMIIRTHLDQILTVGRDTQGVCIIKLNEGHSVSSMAIVPRSEEGENDSEEDNEGFTYDEDYVFRDEEDKEKS
ncbi:MAG TPA: DNA gyrase subunit A [Bacilli bacterium]|nr:DNA gyrase subunit A [Bacilli bacterium]HOD61042.1 DNA gyrase subunit A [Bacilli bacterium]HOH60899.1 DNA gyrase subunit A [Bacilli bacterium]HPB48763.1 DNA gyrase subunit A [Bacilli bacterium]HPM15269.1 DNA gyrase subunit A [Bacilli bacterium]